MVNLGQRDVGEGQVTEIWIDRVAGRYIRVGEEVRVVEAAVEGNLQEEVEQQEVLTSDRIIYVA